MIHVFTIQYCTGYVFSEHLVPNKMVIVAKYGYRGGFSHTSAHYSGCTASSLRGARVWVQMHILLIQAAEIL